MTEIMKHSSCFIIHVWINHSTFRTLYLVRMCSFLK